MSNLYLTLSGLNHEIISDQFIEEIDRIQFTYQDEQKNLSKIENGINSFQKIKNYSQNDSQLLEKNQKNICSFMSRRLAIFLFIISLFGIVMLIELQDFHIYKILSKNLNFNINNKVEKIGSKSIETHRYQSESNNQFLSENQPYHIYPKINTRFSLDVVETLLGQKHLSMYQWENVQNQKFYFERAEENFYYIKNAKTGFYMKKSQIKKSKLNKIKFEAQKDQLWQIVPATHIADNAFYIISSENKSLEILNGYADNGVDIVLYYWTKSDNQVWFFRKNKEYFPSTQQSNQQKYLEQTSRLLNNIVNDSQQRINNCIEIQQIRHQMKTKNIPIPSWMNKPKTIDHQAKLKQFFIKQNIDNIIQGPSSSQNQQKNSIFNTFTNFLQKIIDFFKKQTNFAVVKQIQIKKKYPQNHTIAYIWYSNKQMPQQYQKILTENQNNTRLLTQKDFNFYVQKWNKLEPNIPIITEDFIIRQRINMLKLLYLYFESGIYADFDTQINEKCFGNIFADEIIFTNRMDENLDWQMNFPIQQIVVPEENFMMIRTKYHPQVKRMLQQEIMENQNRGGQRWRQCLYRQCLIIQCQRHYRDNTYKKGFD